MSEGSKIPCYSWGSEESINDFIRYLNESVRILVLCGAGLSAPSGIPTFKGSGAYWRGHKAANLSNIDVFIANPGLVWKYFAERRRLALRALPNKAHFALAKFAETKKGMHVLTQNIDGLSQKAKHPKDRIFELHGSLMDIKCTNESCGYVDKGNEDEPLCPALEALEEDELMNFGDTAEVSRRGIRIKDVMNRLLSVTLEVGQRKTEPKGKMPELDELSNPLMIDPVAQAIASKLTEEVIPIKDLPHCPKCNSLLRPGAVMFGEKLDEETLNGVIDWIEEKKTLELLMVIGTQARDFPATKFLQRAVEKRARVAVVNLDENHVGGMILRNQDWGFFGDAEEVLQALFERAE